MIRLFVGSSGNGEDAESDMLFEHVVRKYTTVPVDITFMRPSHDPDSAWGCWNQRRWATPFSGFRWAIPEYCDHEGRAIYADNDVLFLHDLEELWNTPIPEGSICLAKGNGRFCVVLWDCAAAEAHVPPIMDMREDPLSHQRLTSTITNSGLVGQLDPRWNVFDGEDYKVYFGRPDDRFETEIRGLHLTDMSTNPTLDLSMRRMAERGETHWYDGVRREHRRDDVVRLWKILYEETDGDLTKYVPETKYGPYGKQTLRNYRSSNGFDVTRGE